MDPLHVAVAILPLSAYLLWVGFLNCRRRPFVISGYQDTSLLTLGVFGTVMAGPLELFFPEAFSYQYGPIVWLFLIGLYFLVVTLIILLMRPSIIVYNGRPEIVRDAVERAARTLDTPAQWSGHNLLLPQLGVQLHIDPHLLTRNIQLSSSGALQSIDGWRRLERQLRRELRAEQSEVNYTGAILIGMAMLMMALVLTSLADRDYSVVSALQEMLRLY